MTTTTRRRIRDGAFGNDTPQEPGLSLSLGTTDCAHHPTDGWFLHTHTRLRACRVEYSTEQQPPLTHTPEREHGERTHEGTPQTLSLSLSLKESESTLRIKHATN